MAGSYDVKYMSCSLIALGIILFVISLYYRFSGHTFSVDNALSAFFAVIFFGGIVLISCGLLVMCIHAIKEYYCPQNILI